MILSAEACSKIPNFQEFVCPQHPEPFRLVVDSTNPTLKRLRAQTITIKRETDNPNITFTHADITQQKASYDEALR